MGDGKLPEGAIFRNCQFLQGVRRRFAPSEFEHIINDLSYLQGMFYEIPLSVGFTKGEAVRVSRSSILLKDHLRENALDGATLRLMDWMGNRPHGVRLTYNYQSRKERSEHFAACGLKEKGWSSEVPRISSAGLLDSGSRAASHHAASEIAGIFHGCKRQTEAAGLKITRLNEIGCSAARTVRAGDCRCRE